MSEISLVASINFVNASSVRASRSFSSTSSVFGIPFRRVSSSGLLLAERKHRKCSFFHLFFSPPPPTFEVNVNSIANNAQSVNGHDIDPAKAPAIFLLLCRLLIAELVHHVRWHVVTVTPHLFKCLFLKTTLYTLMSLSELFICIYVYK